MQQQGPIIAANSFGAELYQRYAPAIFAYLYRQTSSREDAEDLLVEVFLAALEHAAHFETLDERKQQAWLWAVARNKAIDHFRRFSRRPSVSLKEVDTIYEDEALAPDQVILKQEEYSHLHTHLKKLSKAQQELLQLRFGHGLSCSEIATVLEKSEGAVRMLLSRTLKLLRVIYKK